MKDERFTHKATTIDKRGRPKYTSMKEDYRQIYDISGSSDEKSEESEEESDGNDDSKMTKAVTEVIAGPDIARGEGLAESSSEDEDAEDDEASNQTDVIEHDWGELDKDAPRMADVTSRLAVCNMDWDRIRAVDILVLLNSFKPERGVIRSVTIYPSEYGLEKMKEENISGPPELRESQQLKDDDSGDNDGIDYHREKLRCYQINRLRFYYAVVVCDSLETANEIYEKCDGIEYEGSANRLDLRFIPEDMTFGDEAKSVATSLPDDYQPAVFTNSALQCSSVSLTWDETPHERVSFMARDFSKDELADQDLRDYVASDTDSEDAYGNLIDDSEWRQDEPDSDASDEEHHNGDSMKIEKFRELIRSLQDDKPARQGGEEFEMEVTWQPGLKEKTEQKLKVVEAKNRKLTPWQEYKEKRARKKLEKKEAKVQKKAAKDDDNTFSDDEIPADVNLHDPYFAEEWSKQGCPMNSTGKAKLMKKKSRKRLNQEDGEMNKHEAAELALLVMDGESNQPPAHLSEDKRSKKKRRKKKKAEKLGSGKDDAVDINDPRFSAIYDNPLYNVDPSAPEFKRSKTMEAILVEKVKRRTRNRMDS